ncbi:MAG: two pore domain potassium channel family protein, partial [Intestinibacter sp.]|nr:two pore domain potassium channel family protein [Intestinibacter sp.]
MIGIIFTVLTVFAIIVLTYKRISKDKFKIIKEIIDDVNEQYKNILKSRARYKNTLQWLIYLISQ